MIFDFASSFAKYLIEQNLQHLIVHVTNHCNYRCDHCFIDFAAKQDMKLEQYQSLAKQVGKLFWLDIAGGEPFLRLDLAEIIAAFDTKVVQIPSNGSLTDRAIAQLEKAKRLTNAEISVSLSLDGLKETHDRIRNHRGSWEQVWETFARLREMGGVSIKINTVINKENAHEILDLMREVRQHQPDFHSVILLRGDPMDPSFGLPPLSDLRSLAKEIFAILATYDYGRNAIAASILRNYHKYLWNVSLQTLEQKTQVIPCLAGQAHMVVWGDGQVSSCEMLPTIGNVTAQSWQEIRNSEALRQQVSDIKAKKCYCTHNCAMLDSIFFNPANIPNLIYQKID
jgi:MoaA/NifB/PqqE/SkfB family radical SAM enzyme